MEPEKTVPEVELKQARESAEETSAVETSPDENAVTEPTQEEIYEAFSDGTNTSETSDTETTYRTRPEWQTILVSALSAIIIFFGGSAIYSLIARGNLSSFTALFSDDTSLKIVSVTPTKTNNNILSNDSHFIIKTENGSIEELRKTLVLEPAVDYDLVEKSAGLKYELVPASSIPDNQVVNVNSVKNGVASYKWAFQTKKALSVSKIYPANGASYVDPTSVVEFNFSYPEVEGVEEHFKISPSVEGTFTKTSRGWRFSPNQALSSDTTYEVTITAGLTYGEETMNSDFHSSFSTFSHAVVSSNDTDHYITFDTISTFTDSQPPVIVTSGDAYDYAAKFSIEKIASADEFIRHLNGESISGEWLDERTFHRIDNSSEYNHGGSLILDETLPVGYYIFHLKSNEGQNLLTANVQINNLSAYAFESERDVVFWVAENGELKSGININYKGNNYKTDETGLLKLGDISDFSDKVDYAKIGDSNTPLIVGLKNYKDNLYPTGFIYTDRPLYKQTDTIKIWGFVPVTFFADYPKLDNFNLSLSYWNNSDTITPFKQKISINPDGTFSAELKLDNFIDHNYVSIKLSYDDAVIAYRSVTIEDYSLENYSYEFVMPKNYVLSGEDIEFKVKVSHVTGFPAANKDLVVTYESHDYYGTTNSYGEASFVLPTNNSFSSESDYGAKNTKSIIVKSAGAEYNKYSTGVSFYVYKTNLALGAIQDEANKTINFTAKTLDLSAEVIIDWNDANIPQTNYSGPATVKAYEVKTTRTITGYYYNEYTKKNTPKYTYDYQYELIDSKDIEVKDGVYKYSYPTEYKLSTEDTYYSYYALISATDTLGRPAFSHKEYYHWGSFLGEGSNNNTAIVDWDYSSGNIPKFSEYTYYRFKFSNASGSMAYNIGDSMVLGLYDYNGDKVQNNGKILTIGYKERVFSTSIYEEDDFNYTYDHNSYPGAKFIGAYFVDGKFHRIMPSYYDYDESNSEITVSIETDKDSYEPGDHIKAKVIATYPDGSRVPSGRVNLSVVNEAVFNAITDNTDILRTIYTNKIYKNYSMSTFRDYDLSSSGGGRGAAGGTPRSNFGDTLYFEEKSFINGEAEFEFDLNDSITSFRLTAIATRSSDTVAAGVGIKKINSFLSLSLSTVMPKKVKNTDDLVLNATSPVSGSDLIHYTFEIKDTDKRAEATGNRGEIVYANLGKLALGNYTIIISGQDDVGNKDSMEYPLEVIESAQEVAVKQTVNLSETPSITPVKNPIIVEVYNKEAKKYIDYLSRLETNLTERLDTQIAYYKAQALRNKIYGEKNSTSAPNFEAYLTNAKLVKNLENAEGDLVLTALSNYYAPNYFDLQASNYSIEIGDDLTTTLEKLLVLASFKEPVLLDLYSTSRRWNAGGEHATAHDRIVLGLAYAFLGDYDAAKKVRPSYEAAVSSDYSRDKDLLAILATFIDKTEATKRIDQVLAEEPSAEYINFAVISFFLNNEAEISKKETVKILQGNNTETITLHGLSVVKRVYSSSDLSSLRFNTSSKNLYATYYYQGRISELTEYRNDIVARIEGNTTVGSTVQLILNISGLAGEERNSQIHLALPAGLKFSATFSSSDGLYLSRNNNEYVKLSLTQSYRANEIIIPLYVAAPGNYELEPIIFVHGNDDYHLSNSVDVTLNK